MAEPYSPLRYPGGKAKLAKFLISVIESNGLHEPHYVEPYAGGAGAALRLLFEEYVGSIHINDADPRVWSFWRAITEQNDAFVDLLRRVVVTVEEWHQQRAVYEDAARRSVLEVGFATFFLNRTTRSGIIHNGGPIGGKDQSGKYKIDARFNREQLIQRIERIGLYSDRIEVTRFDGIELLRRIEDSHDAAKSFVYIDPPYYAKGSELYLNRFSHEQHAELAAFLRTPRSFPWVMTYDDVEPIRHLYHGVKSFGFSLSYSAYERRAGQELLIHPQCINIPDSSLAALPVMA